MHVPSTERKRTCLCESFGKAAKKSSVIKQVPTRGLLQMKEELVPVDTGLDKVLVSPCVGNSLGHCVEKSSDANLRLAGEIDLVEVEPSLWKDDCGCAAYLKWLAQP